MSSQTLVLVALPNGAAQNRLRLSLYLTPRLDAGATLANFPDFLNWPGQIQAKGLKFKLTCGSQNITVPANTSALRPDVWKSIFTPSTFVAPFETSALTNRLIVSYPVGASLVYLKYLYQAVGSGTLSNLGDGNRDSVLRQVLYPLVFRDGENSSLASAISYMRLQMWQEQHPGATIAAAPQTAQPRVVAVPPDGTAASTSMPANVQDTLTRFAAFHNMPSAPNRPPLPSGAAGFAKTLDFHQALTTLSSYPALMRSLGLVFDIEVPATFCPASPSATGYASVSVSAIQAGFSWSLTPQYSFPSTAYVRSATAFAAAPATAPAQLNSSIVNGDSIDGFLALSPNYYQLMQVDADGALLSALTLADNVAFTAFNSTEPGVLGTDLNALRTAGIGLIAGGRGAVLLQSITENNAFNQALTGNTGYPRPFNAQDLTRGFRIDIYSTRDSQWHSLHRRNGTYTIGTAQTVIQTTDEEGFVQLAAASPADDPTREADPVATANDIPQPGTDLFVHERVARWDGWSLSAQRPGLALNRSADPAMATTPDPTMDTAMTPFKLITQFAAAPGSLPLLRFGDQYRLRARTVDLAGNSLPLQSDTPTSAALPAAGVMLPYMRFEPVPPPLLLLQDPAQPGATLERLVIRSFNSVPFMDDVATTASDSRHVAPPRTSQRMAEQLGMFDNVYGRLRGDASEYQSIIQRDNYELPTQGGVPLVSAAYLPVSYLPDPLSRGAALRNLPYAPDDTYGTLTQNQLNYTALPDVQPEIFDLARASVSPVLQVLTTSSSVTFIDFGNQWPQRQAFLMTMQEGQSAPVWDATTRTLQLNLEKASVAVINLSSFLSASDLTIMGVWGWIREFFESEETFLMTPSGDAGVVPYESAVLSLLTRLVTEGGHAMITPSRTITLVHAVQQPLGQPAFIQLPVVHQPTNPIFASALRNYFTPITAWRSVGSHQVVLLGGMQINAGSSSRIDIMGSWNELVDDLSLPGPTSSVQSDHVETIPLAQPEAGPIYAPGSTTRMVAVYIPPVDNLWFAAPFDELSGVGSPVAAVAAPLHNFNDTKHRWVTYTATATSCFQEYFPPGLDFTRSSDPLVVDVPCSSRPTAPDVHYVVPTFGWENQETTNVKSTIRIGNSVRVYLNRPWYSSGADELLGVVLWPSAIGAPTDVLREQYKPYFTQWGSDPIWQTGAVDLVPGISDFPNAVATATGLTLEETPQTFDVAGHAVQYDEGRQLWFCDIEFNNPTSYSPFVRMALARYQTHSIQGVELSRTVLSDFVQLSPDRSAVLSINPANPTLARVFVAGLAPTGPAVPLLTVTVEQQLPNVLTDMGWQAAASGVVTVTEDSPAPNQPGNLLWSGTIAFQKPPAAGGFRVVVREFEQIPIYSGGTGTAAPIYGQRLVYAATIAYDFPAIPG